MKISFIEPFRIDSFVLTLHKDLNTEDRVRFKS